MAAMVSPERIACAAEARSPARSTMLNWAKPHLLDEGGARPRSGLVYDDNAKAADYWVTGRPRQTMKDPARRDQDQRPCVVVVDEDRSEVSRAFVEQVALRQSQHRRACRRSRLAAQAIRSGDTMRGIYIPANFDARPQGRAPAAGCSPSTTAS